MERCTWTKRQDQHLKTVIQSMQGEINWKVVSKILETQHKVFQKSAKKCRERWNTKINPAYNSKNWTADQQKLMLQLQGQLGNKWSIIRNFFQNRTDVFLKNQFYSIFRKALRKINDHMIKTKKYLPLRQFNSTLMNNVLVVNQTKFTNHLELPQELLIMSQYIKYIIIQINTKQNQQKIAFIQKAIVALIEFKNTYNKKSKVNERTNDSIETNKNYVKQEENQNPKKLKDVSKNKPLFYQQIFEQSIVADDSTISGQKQEGFVKIQFSSIQKFQSLPLSIITQFPFFNVNESQMYNSS